MRALCVPFRVDDSGNLMWTSREDRMWDDRVISVVGTLRGTRVQRPEFGLPSAPVLFEDRNEGTEAAIRDAFTQSLPRLTLISASTEHSELFECDVITVKYRLPNGALSTSQITMPAAAEDTE
jgi:phage baseplate assembly protein W